MKKFTFAVLFAVVMLASFGANAAQTISQSDQFITIQFTDLDDSTGDVTWNKISASTVNVSSIVFIPGAIGNSVSIRNGSITGPRIITFTSLDGEPRQMTYSGEGAMMAPYIDYTDCSLSEGSYLIIKIK